MSFVQSIHQKAIICAREFQKSEAALLSVIQEIDQNKIFRKLGYHSLHDYLVVGAKVPTTCPEALAEGSRRYDFRYLSRSFTSFRTSFCRKTSFRARN